MISEHGVASVTMRAIAGRLGVSRAALYRHFADKTALLVAVAAAGFKRLNDRVQAIDAGAPRSSVDRFRRLGEEYVRFALENPAHYRLMYGREALTREDLPELREAANALYEHLVEVIDAGPDGYWKITRDTGEGGLVLTARSTDSVLRMIGDVTVRP